MKFSEENKRILISELAQKGRLDPNDLTNLNKIETVDDYVEFLTDNVTKYWDKIKDEHGT